MVHSQAVQLIAFLSSNGGLALAQLVVVGIGLWGLLRRLLGLTTVVRVGLALPCCGECSCNALCGICLADRMHILEAEDSASRSQAGDHPVS